MCYIISDRIELLFIYKWMLTALYLMFIHPFFFILFYFYNVFIGFGRL